MSRSVKTIALVAGETSGDLLGSHLIDALKQFLPDARFIGIGGPKMRTAGMDILFPMEKLAVFGVIDALRHYREILAAISKLTPRIFFILSPRKSILPTGSIKTTSLK